MHSPTQWYGELPAGSQAQPGKPAVYFAGGGGAPPAGKAKAKAGGDGKAGAKAGAKAAAGDAKAGAGAKGGKAAAVAVIKDLKAPAAPRSWRSTRTCHAIEHPGWSLMEPFLAVLDNLELALVSRIAEVIFRVCLLRDFPPPENSTSNEFPGPMRPARSIARLAFDAMPAGAIFV